MLLQAEPIQLEITKSNDLSDRISNVVARNPFLDTRQIQFTANGNRVVIHGNVETYFKKQMAQEAVRNIEGVKSIDNQLEVSWN